MPELTEKEKQLLHALDSIAEAYQVGRLTVTAAQMETIKAMIKKAQEGPVLHKGKTLKISLELYRGRRLAVLEKPAPRYTRKATRDWLHE